MTEKHRLTKDADIMRFGRSVALLLSLLNRVNTDVLANEHDIFLLLEGNN